MIFFSFWKLDELCALILVIIIFCINCGYYQYPCLNSFITKQSDRVFMDKILWINLDNWITSIQSISIIWLIIFIFYFWLETVIQLTREFSRIFLSLSWYSHFWIIFKCRIIVLNWGVCFPRHVVNIQTKLICLPIFT